jgi:adenylate cyclase
MDAGGTPIRFSALAERLLEHRLRQPDLAGGLAGPGGEALRTAFRRLAELFALDRAYATGQSVGDMIAPVTLALRVAVRAASCRILLRGEHGGLVAVREDGAVGDHLQAPAEAGLTGAAMRDREARRHVEIERQDGFLAAVDWLDGKAPASLACAPLVRVDGELVGAVQLFDKADGGPFTDADLGVLAAAAPFLAELAANSGLLPWLADGARLVPRAEAALAGLDGAGREVMLSKILGAALAILGADRGWIFLHDAATDELFTCLAEGLGSQELRVGLRSGVAGAVYRTGEALNIPEAYQDPRFNPAIDWQLGYRTRSILCAPIFAADGRRLGVVQLVNKRHGAFTATDETHLKALAAQMGVTLDYTALFEQVLRMKSYNESMLRSLSNGVLTVGMDGEVSFVNGAALRILRRAEGEVLHRSVARLFGEMNAWVLEAIDWVAGNLAERSLPNSELYVESADLWVPMNLSILPLLDARATFLGVMLVIEDLERERELRRTMSRYLSNQVIDQLLEQAGDVLGGTDRTVTTLFSDIRGFTSLSEELGAAGTVAMLNEYFAYMEDVVANHSGVIDKYIGDAVMALFGSPFPSEADADNAVRAAADMQRVLALLNARRSAAGAAPIRIGVGIATGTVVVGNIGSPKRMDFTVIGDPVNLASRIESITKLYGAEILACDETVRRLREPVPMRRLDVVRVKGQQRATGLFEILAHRDADAASVAAYEAALDRYLAGDWRAAVAGFEAAARLRDDAATRLMLARCRGFLADPPAAWEGVSVLDSK